MTRLLDRVGVVVLAGAAATVAAAADAPETAAYKVIVHAEHSSSSVSREVLADIFLRKATHWENGEPIDVVEHSIQSELRAEFGRDALRMEPRAVMAYWRRQIDWEGRRPPRVLGSEAEILEYVASHPVAIGYVGAEAVTTPDVRVLQLTD